MLSGMRGRAFFESVECLWAQLRDVPGAHRQHQIAVLRSVYHVRCRLGELGRIARVRDAGGEPLPGDTWNWLFARGVDIEHLHGIAIAKAVRKGHQQVARSRIPMRLEYHVNMPEATLT